MSHRRIVQCRIIALTRNVRACQAFLGSAGETAPGVLSAAALREWFLPRYVYPGGQAGFGMPWELRGGPAGLLVTKGGNIDQFGSQLSFDPEARVGVWLAANAPGPVASDLSDALTPPLFAAFAAAVAAAATARAPPAPDAFVGTYEGYSRVLLANMTIAIAYQDLDPPAGGTATSGAPSDGARQLVATFAWGSGGGLATLSGGASATEAVMTMPPSLPVPCLLRGELAWDGERLLLGAGGAHLTMPNLMPGATFARVVSDVGAETIRAPGTLKYRK